MIITKQTRNRLDTEPVEIIECLNLWQREGMLLKFTMFEQLAHSLNCVSVSF